MINWIKSLHPLSLFIFCLHEISIGVLLFVPVSSSLLQAWELGHSDRYKQRDWGAGTTLVLVKLTDYCTKINADYFLPSSWSASPPDIWQCTQQACAGGHITPHCQSLEGPAGGWCLISELNVTESQRRSWEKTLPMCRRVCECR